MAKRTIVLETPKFLNQKTEIDGIKFDSKKEAQRYLELKLMVRAKEIYDLELQKRMSLNVEGQKVCSYVADFVYKNRYGQTVIEDVKSPITRKLPAYRIKKKLVKAIYGIEIQEV